MVRPEHIYEDTASGRRDDRPGLRACLKALRSNDTLVICKLNCLRLDLRRLVNLVENLTKLYVGLTVMVVKGFSIDTITANGRFDPRELCRTVVVHSGIDR